MLKPAQTSRQETPNSCVQQHTLGFDAASRFQKWSAPALDCDKTYRPSGAVTISDVAQFISAQCGIPVLVSPEALNPALTSVPATGGRTVSTTAQENPESLVGLFPTGGSQASSQQSSFSEGYPSQTSVSGIKYQGRISGLLDLVTTRLGLSWHWSEAERAVRVNYFDTKVFDVYAFGDSQTLETVVKSGMNTTTGTSSGTTGAPVRLQAVSPAAIKAPKARSLLRS